jgi:hypothetical protein
MTRLLLQYANQPVDQLGVSMRDVDFLSEEFGIEWTIDPEQILESAPFSEFELADLRDNGISLESDNQFLQKRGISPLDGSF